MCRMRAFRKFLAALMVAALLMSACAPAALASIKAKVFTNTKIYSIPSTSGKSVRVPEGLTVRVTATSGNWAKIRYKGKTAYIPTPYLNLASRLKAYTAKSTPVYKLPSSSSSKMGTLSIATAVYVVAKLDGYYRIENSSGSVTGYVRAGNLTSKAKLTAAYNAYKRAKAARKGGSSATSKLLSLLKSLCGKPYAANANPPSSFNCSALVQYVMGTFGISMKGTAREQATDSRYSKISSSSSLKVGDVLCFDENSDGVCDHTAIYIGSGYMVDASKNAGKVRATKIDSWYKSHFLCARRP